MSAKFVLVIHVRSLLTQQVKPTNGFINGPTSLVRRGLVTKDTSVYRLICAAIGASTPL